MFNGEEINVSDEIFKKMISLGLVRSTELLEELCIVLAHNQT